MDQDGLWDIASIGTYTMVHWQVTDGVWLDRIVGQGDDRVHPADLDGDGLFDLVAVQGLEVGWYQQLPGRRFSSFTPLGSLLLPGSGSVGLVLTGLGAGDFDGDGNRDIAASAQVPAGAPEPGVLVVLGVATAAPSNVVPVGFAGGVDALCVTDLDTDGKEELLVSGGGSLQAFESQGAFWSAIQSFQIPAGIGSSIFEIEAYDLDEDGLLDIALAGSGASTVLLSGLFYQSAPLVQGLGAGGFSEVEVGADAGGLGVVVLRSSNTPNKAITFRWDGTTQSFGQVGELGLSGGGSNLMFSADWPNCGVPRDCIRRMHTHGPDTVGLALLVKCGADNCGFGRAALVRFRGGLPGEVCTLNKPFVSGLGELLDADGDGALDWAIRSSTAGPSCGQFGTGGVSLHKRQAGAFDVWSSDGPGGFNQYFDSSGRYYLEASDLLNGGTASAVVIAEYSGAWVAWQSPQLGPCAIGGLFDCGFGPCSAISLAAGNGLETSGFAWRSGQGSWGTCEVPGVDVGGSSVLLDLEWDRDLDLVIGDALHVVEDGGAAPPQVIPGSVGIERWCRDLDGDIRLDLVVATATGIEWLRNNGTGGFEAPQLLWPGVQDLEIMDWNQDGVVDLIGVVGAAIEFRQGLGGGAFGPAIEIPLTGCGVPVQPIHPVVADLDRDGDLDLIVQDQSGPRMRCVSFLNQAGPRDCDGSGTSDHEEIAAGIHEDSDRNGQPDRCDIAQGLHSDLNQNGVPDACEYAGEPWWITSPVNGHRYASTTPMTAEEARIQARAWGGSLVTLRSADEQAWVIGRFGTPAEPVWIGISDRQDEGVFRWHSKEVPAFTSWAPGAGVVGLPDDVILDPALGEWAEVDGAALYVAVVEQGDCDGDGLVDAIQIEQDPTLDWDGNGLLDSCAGLSANYCSANINMDGLIGRIAAAGSPLLAQNDLELLAFDLPANQFGYFVFSRSQGYISPFGGGQGALCLSAPIRRLSAQGQVLNTGIAGEVQLGVDTTGLPSGETLIVGESLNFQFWHREYDTSGNPTSNTSDAIEICFR
jgi:hypothetical protein